jgi:peptide/nickel transport system ATP-binding protein
VLVSHDLGVVAGTADRVQVMYGGTIVETGPTEEVFERPRMPYTVGLLSSLPVLDQLGGRLTPIPGAPPSLLALPPGCSFAPRCPLVEDACRAEEPALIAVGAGDAAQRSSTIDSDHSTRCRRWQVLADGGATDLFTHVGGASGSPGGATGDDRGASGATGNDSGATGTDMEVPA